jgi:hypothetical protein
LAKKHGLNPISTGEVAMINKLVNALKLEAAAVKTWDKMTPKERKTYLAAHPKTKMDLEKLEQDDRSGHFSWGDGDVVFHDGPNAKKDSKGDDEERKRQIDKWCWGPGDVVFHNGPEDDEDEE